MPKVLFSLLVATALLAGCDTRSDELDSAAARYVMNMDGQAQRLAFNLLTPDERALMWSIRLTELRSAVPTANLGKHASVTREQLFDEFVHVATDADNFKVPRSTSDSIRLSTWFGSWLNRAEKVFTAAEVYNIAFSAHQRSSLSDTTGLPSSSPVSSKSSQFSNKSMLDRNCRDCCCSVGSSWTCYKPSLSWKDFGIQYGECTDGFNCHEPSSLGCGGGFLQSCDGSSCQW